MVSLTGDTATGKEIAAAAAQTVKRLHLELGGKAPVVVFDDADLTAVAEAVKLAGFFNSGQDCTAATRIIASAKVYDNLLQSSCRRSSRSRSATRPTPRTSTWARSSAAAQRDRVAGYVDRARGYGASVATGGSANGHGGGRGFFYDPTVVTDIGQDSEIIQQEVFGPVVTVQRFAMTRRRSAGRTACPTASRRRSGRATSSGRSTRHAAALRHGLDQRPPDDRVGDASRRLRPVRLRQGHEHVLDRGLHDRQARHGQDQLMRPLMRVLLVGAGTVGEAIAKVAADRDWLEHMLVTDYDLDRAKYVVDSIDHGGKYEAHQIDASSAERVAHVAKDHGIDLVMNAVDPQFVMPIFDGALRRRRQLHGHGHEPVQATSGRPLQQARAEAGRRAVREGCRRGSRQGASRCSAWAWTRA